MVRFDDVQVGDALPAIRMGPVSRTTLALFAGASGDHNPIHVDLDFARRAGMPDVFAHGMLGMAWLGRVLTGWVPQARLVSFEVRFLGITHLGHVLDCTGRVVALDEGARRVTVELATVNQYGERKIAGKAVVALP